MLDKDIFGSCVCMFSPAACPTVAALLSESTFVRLWFPEMSLSNSASRALLPLGTFPIVYGFPLSVAACFHVFDFLEPRRPAIPSRLRMVGFVPWLMSELRYSAGTNSSKRTRVAPVRGSGGVLLSEEPKESEGADGGASPRDDGRDLNSTCV